MGARDEAYSGFAAVAPEPRFDQSGKVPLGHVIAGWAAYMVGQEEEDLLLAVGSLIGNEPSFVALTPDVSLRPDPDLDALRPDQVGQDWREPVGVGQEVVTDDWVVTVEEVLRGEEAWTRIVAHNQFNDPPPEGLEYALAFVRMRHIGDGDVPYLASDAFFIGTEGAEAVEQPSVVDPEPNLHAILFPGGASVGWVVVTVAEGSVDARMAFKHSVGSFLPDDFNTRYFELPRPGRTTPE